MTKEAYYFSHDTNARNDPKCSALIADFGGEGYGIYWMMIEVLAEQKDYKLEKFPKLYDGLARQFQMDAEAVRSIIEALLHDYELLVEDDDFIWSESLLRRMDIKRAKRQAKVEAGRKGGLASGVSRSKGKNSEANAKQNEAVLEANEPKESKVKESKRKKDSTKEGPPKKKFAEFVSLTEEEHAKLVDKLGEQGTARAIEILDNYKGSKGKRYKSDYRTILNWVVDRLKQEQPKAEPAGYEHQRTNLTDLQEVIRRKTMKGIDTYGNQE